MKFLEQRHNIERDNLQLRYLSGQPLSAPVTESNLEAVKEMVRSGIITVGIQERLLKSVKRMAIFKGADISNMSPVNISTFGFNRASMTDAEIDAFRKLSALDMKLYKFCLQFFDEESGNMPSPSRR